MPPLDFRCVTWLREKEKILNSLLGPSQELDFPSEAEVKLCYLYMTDVLSATRQLLSLSLIAELSDCRVLTQFVLNLVFIS